MATFAIARARPWLPRAFATPATRQTAARLLAPLEVLSAGRLVHPPLVSSRGATGFSQPQALRLFQTSPGIVVDKFVPVPKSALPSLFSRAGLAVRWANLKGLTRSTLSVARLRQRLSDWKPIPFAEQVGTMFEEMNKAFTSGNKTALRNLVTDKVYTELKGEMKHHQPGQAMWLHAGYVDRPRVVHVRVIPLQDKSTEFAQVTVRLHTRQTLTGSTPVRTRESVDYIVVESTITSKTPWRICGRLTPRWATGASSGTPSDVANPSGPKANAP